MHSILSYKTSQFRKNFSSDTASAANICHVSRQQDFCPFLMVFCRYELLSRGREENRVVGVVTASAFHKAGAERL